jgi:hypothetical protein
MVHLAKTMMEAIERRSSFFRGPVFPATSCFAPVRTITTAGTVAPTTHETDHRGATIAVFFATQASTPGNDRSRDHGAKVIFEREKERNVPVTPKPVGNGAQTKAAATTERGSPARVLVS